MHKFKLICLSTLLAAGVANAGTPCNGFEVKIKNNVAEDFLINKIVLQGAEIQPNGVEKLNAHSELVFTVNKSIEGQEMVGDLELHTVSLPSKKVSLNFTLNNKNLVCEHVDTGSDGDFKIEKSRMPGHVAYSIE